MTSGSMVPPVLTHDVSHMLAMLPHAGYPSPLPWVHPASPSIPVASAALGMSAHANAGLAFPPGLDVPAPTLATSPVAETGAAPIGVWALEAKLKAEQTQARQREWAEKMQLQYLRGQEV